MRNWRLAMVVAVVAGVGGAWGAAPGGTGVTRVNPGVDLNPELAIDEATMAKAVARGEAMLKGAKWSVGIEGLIKDSVRLYDAGGYVVVAPATNMAMAVTFVEKATGKRVGESPVVRILGVSGDNGGEVLELYTSGAATMSLRNLAEQKVRWRGLLPSNGDWGFIAGGRVFIGAAVPGMRQMPLPRGAEPLHPTSTKLALEVVSYDHGTGKEQWRYALPENTLEARPSACANGVLYVVASPGGALSGTNGAMVIGVNVADGKELFRARSTPYLDEGGHPISERWSDVAVNGDELVAATWSSKVIGLDGRTGKETWREGISLSKEPGKVMLGYMGHFVFDAPVVAGDKIVVRVEGDTKPSAIPGVAVGVDLAMAGLAAFDAKTHKQVWFYRPPEDTLDRAGGAAGRKTARQLTMYGMQVEGNEIVALAAGSWAAMVGVDLKTGKLNWLMKTQEQVPNGPFEGWQPLVSGGVMYFVKDSKLVAVPVGG